MNSLNEAEGLKTRLYARGTSVFCIGQITNLRYSVFNWTILFVKFQFVCSNALISKAYRFINSFQHVIRTSQIYLEMFVIASSCIWIASVFIFFLFWKYHRKYPLCCVERDVVNEFIVTEFITQSCAIKR